MATNHTEIENRIGIESEHAGIYSVADGCANPSERLDFVVDVVGRKMAKNEMNADELQYAFAYMVDVLDDLEDDPEELEVARARVAQMAQNVNLVESEELAYAFQDHGIRAY